MWQCDIIVWLVVVTDRYTTACRAVRWYNIFDATLWILWWACALVSSYYWDCYMFHIIILHITCAGIYEVTVTLATYTDIIFYNVKSNAFTADFHPNNIVYGLYYQSDQIIVVHGWYCRFLLKKTCTTKQDCVKLKEHMVTRLSKFIRAYDNKVVQHYNSMHCNWVYMITHTRL